MTQKELLFRRLHRSAIIFFQSIERFLRQADFDPDPTIRDVSSSDVSIRRSCRRRCRRRGRRNSCC